MKPHFAVLSVGLTVDKWSIVKDAVRGYLEKIPKDHVVIGLGIWVFRLPAAAAAIHSLTHLFKRRGCRFVLASLNTPLLAGLSAETRKQLQELGADFYDVSNE